MALLSLKLLSSTDPLPGACMQVMPDHLVTKEQLHCPYGCLMSSVHSANVSRWCLRSWMGLLLLGPWLVVPPQWRLKLCKHAWGFGSSRMAARSADGIWSFSHQIRSVFLYAGSMAPVQKQDGWEAMQASILMLILRLPKIVLRNRVPSTFNELSSLAQSGAYSYSSSGQHAYRTDADSRAKVRLQLHLAGNSSRCNAALWLQWLAYRALAPNEPTA